MMECDPDRPLVKLPPNQPSRFYRGGAAIAAFRNTPDVIADRPEDWIASTVSVFGDVQSGLTVLPDGRTLRDAIRGAPGEWLGSAHAEAFGADPVLLVKLLDAGERLPVHCHPPDDFARAYCHSAHGKTEAWIILGTEGEDATVYVGFAQEVSPATLARWVAEQDTALIDTLVPIQVHVGDVVFVPAGVPHALGAGVFVVELQQPTDLSLLLEWQRFVTDPQDAHLGLGFDLALQCVDRSSWGNGRWKSLVVRDSRIHEVHGDSLPPAARAFFRAQRLCTTARVTLPPDYGVLVVVDGMGAVTAETGQYLELRRGDVVLVPYGAGSCRIEGDVDLIRCRPPAPTARSDRR